MIPLSSFLPKRDPVPQPAAPALRPPASATTQPEARREEVKPAAVKVAPLPGKKGGPGFLLLAAIAVVVLLALLFIFGVWPRFAAKADLDREQKINQERDVIYALAKLAAPTVELPLPGTVEAFQQASIYARTNGYVKKWNVDIGDTVKQGDILAEIDTPEVDQQLSQAKANVQQYQAALSIAQTAAERWDAMVKAHAVSQQEADEKNATLSEARANLAAGNASVGQLTALENFKRIVAPFTGKITYRNIEIGNLVTAPTGSNANTSGTTEIFRIAQTDPLRVYIDVPESNSRAIKPGVPADLHVPAYPDRVFHGEIVRSAGALDTTSRTLRTEVRVANPDGALLPGTFADVRLSIVDDTPAVLIPANTLIVNSSGTQVAEIVSENGQDKIHFMKVNVGRDFGTAVEILQDVKDGDRLVTNPPADLTEGAIVVAKPLDQPPTSALPAPKS